MAQIVLGIGASHTPLLTLGAEQWMHRAAVDYANPRLNLSDGRWLSYEQLLAEVGPVWSEVVTPDVLQEKARRCHAALDRLADALEDARPDVVVIIGDDQTELFTAANRPVVALFHGDEVVMNGKYGDEESPDWVRRMGRGYLMDENHRVPGSPDFATALIEGLMEAEIDVTCVASVDDDDNAGFGHAYGFIVKRLFKNRRIPIVPVLLNTYYPPNVPTAKRTLEMGRALGKAISLAPQDLRVAIVASGGLSHFVVDEELDRRVLNAFADGDGKTLAAIRPGELNAGSSEILNWVMAAGAMEGAQIAWHAYEPLYRTPAGTGVGAAFVLWRPHGDEAKVSASDMVSAPRLASSQVEE
ncbi:protocatechuate 3,4-dioxygenase [Variovorax sp. LT1R16]|uniref:DODA-type extradiol aromatic ring-opening family dioxygenase n=1 Tax=Variovorax sp. LT1R16 TaxID=3443728 RepID=UPI003F4668A6